MHSHQIKRRKYHDGRGQVAAAELIQRLPVKGETIHFLMDGNFTLAAVIPVIQSLIGEPCRLTICTLGLNDATTDALAAMLKAGSLAELRLAFSSYFRASDTATAERAVEVLTKLGAQVAVERLHAKIQLWQPATAPDRWRVIRQSVSRVWCRWQIPGLRQVKPHLNYRKQILRTANKKTD